MLSPNENTTDAWRFAMAGLVASIVGPRLAEWSGGMELGWALLVFGGALGALDTVGEDRWPVVVGRVGAGLAMGGVLWGWAAGAGASMAAGGLILGLGVVLSRWIFWPREVRSLPAAIVAMTIAGVGFWLTAHQYVGASDPLTMVQPAFWGISAGMGCVFLEWYRGHEERLEEWRDEMGTGGRWLGCDGPEK